MSKLKQFIRRNDDPQNRKGNTENLKAIQPLVLEKIALKLYDRGYSKDLSRKKFRYIIPFPRIFLAEIARFLVKLFIITKERQHILDLE